MGLFREVNEGKFDNLDSKASQKMSDEVRQAGESSAKTNDKAVEIASTAAGTSQAESAKGFSASTTNFRDTLTEQARATQETVLGEVQANMITAEDVEFLEKKFGRPLETLRVMSTFSNVAENPIKAMSELNRMIIDAQKA